MDISSQFVHSFMSGNLQVKTSHTSFVRGCASSGAKRLRCATSLVARGSLNVFFRLHFTAITSISIIHASHHQAPELVTRAESRYGYSVWNINHAEDCSTSLGPVRSGKSSSGPQTMLPSPAWLYRHHCLMGLYLQR